jgi:hypothetical protein
MRFLSLDSSRIRLIACLFIPVLAIGATERGEWMLSRSSNSSTVRLSFQSAAGEQNHFNSSSDWKAADLQGLDWSATGKHDVRFKVVRDAGTITCEGFLDGHEGAGLFTFQPDSGYKREMAALGYTGVTEDNQFAFTLHDVSLQFARDIRTAGIQNIDTGKLLAFRIHGVSPEFVKAMQAAGVGEKDADKLIAFRIHGVSPDFVRELGNSGIGTTASDKLIAFRIHGVSAEYVKQLQRLGYSHPDADKLIALRIHGVTPEYIESLRSHGMRNLTLDQLVSLRIHGIN